MTNIHVALTAKKTSSLLALVGAMVLTSVPMPAHAAASVTGQITQMEFNAGNSSWPQVAIQVNSVTTNYYSQQPSPGCGVPTNSADTVKAMQSLAQAAFLAGKPVVINYNTCNGANYIFDLVVQK
jgi:hypothetical protein